MEFFYGMCKTWTCGTWLINKVLSKIATLKTSVDNDILNDKNGNKRSRHRLLSGSLGRPVFGIDFKNAGRWEVISFGDLQRDNWSPLCLREFGHLLFQIWSLSAATGTLGPPDLKLPVSLISISISISIRTQVDGDHFLRGTFRSRRLRVLLSACRVCARRVWTRQPTRRFLRLDLLEIRVSSMADRLESLQ